MGIDELKKAWVEAFNLKPGKDREPYMLHPDDGCTYFWIFLRKLGLTDKDPLANIVVEEE